MFKFGETPPFGTETLIEMALVLFFFTRSEDSGTCQPSLKEKKNAISFSSVNYSQETRFIQHFYTLL